VGDFFGTGIIVADFRLVGMTAWARERLKILHKTCDSWWAHALSTLSGTPSGPAAFLGFTARSTRLISCSSTVSEGGWWILTGVGLEQRSVTAVFQSKQRNCLACYRITQVSWCHITASVVGDAL